jgi:tetratricopeptide (TPR) repeat protein
MLVLCLGLMAKSMLVTLPFVLLLLDFWPLSRFQFASDGYDSRNKRLIIEKIPLFILVAVSSVATFVVQRSWGAMEAGEDYSLTVRITNALVSYVSYIGKTIYPKHLAVFYPHPGGSLPVWQPIICFMILVVVSAGVIYTARRRRYLVVGWLWYLGTLVPVIGLVQVGMQAMADRYTYLPSIGIFIMVGWGAAELFAKWRFRKVGLGISAGIVLAAMLICSRMQVKHWQNDLILFGHAVAVTEKNYVMHNNYGCALRENGKFELAVQNHIEALRIKPDYPAAINNLGMALKAQGKISEATEQWKKVLEFDPEHPSAHANLGLAMTEQGKYDEAIMHFNRALQTDPDFPDVHYILGNIYHWQGKFDAAIQDFNEELRIKPDHLAASINLAHSLFESGKIQSAIDRYYKILQVEPNQVEVLNALASILATTGDSKIQNPTDAVKFAKRACELTNYKQPEILDTLAIAYASTNKFSEAIKTTEKAIKLAKAEGKKELAQKIQKRLQLYRVGHPYRKK